MINTPFLDAKPIPLQNVSGIDKTNAQGQETTKNVNPLNTQSYQTTLLDISIIIGGIIAIIAAPDAFGMALRKQNYSPIFNPRGEYVNYWYNMEYWCYYSNLENVVIIKKSRG